MSLSELRMLPSKPPAKLADYLSVLAATPAETLKAFVESLLPRLEPVTVLENRTGLVMLPYTDSVSGAQFFLGEALVAEAHVRLAGQEGYAACLGNDLEQALAIAILDAVMRAKDSRELKPTRYEAQVFVLQQAQQQAAADDMLLQQVAATQVEVETL
jgi:alpha-D-ribose 1-methylphosphonate 5-triphosphate synthase subunit PhnG